MSLFRQIVLTVAVSVLGIATLKEFKIIHGLDYRLADKSLQLLDPTLNTTQEQIVLKLLQNHADVCAKKEPMLRELAAAQLDLDVELCYSLPDWSQVVDLYGAEPIVLGLDTCEAYRNHIQRDGQSPMPKVAALWNAGSTSLSRSFLLNLQLYDPTWHINRTTVPWGKHTPLWLKFINTYPEDNTDSKDHVLPIVIVRDPYRWMNSMCKNSYGAKWKRGLNDRCPNLIPTVEERKHPDYAGVGDLFDLNASNKQSYWNVTTHYDSLANLWSEFNSDYLYSDSPRLIVRMEDTIFHMEAVMRIISECSGMPMRKPLLYYVEQAKARSDTTLATAMMAYGTAQGRISTNLTSDELEYLRQEFNPELMSLLHYPQVHPVIQ